MGPARAPFHFWRWCQSKPFSIRQQRSEFRRAVQQIGLIMKTDQGTEQMIPMISEAKARQQPTPTDTNSLVELFSYATDKGCLGHVLVARSHNGVCAILMGSDRAALEAALAARFPQTTLVANEADVRGDLASVLRFLDNPASGL